MVTELETKNGYREWTPEEDALVLQGLPYKEVALRTGRTYSAVASRARVCRLAKQKRDEPAAVIVEKSWDSDEGQETMLESAVAGMNHNADVLQETAAMLREERRRHDELKRVFKLAVFNLNLLLEFHCSQCGNGPLSDAVKGFLASVETLNP